MRKPLALRLVLLALAATCATPARGAVSDGRLLRAVRAQDSAAVSRLLKEAIDVNVSGPDGATALHWAVYLDDASIASSLIRAGARVDAANEYGVTPLVLACAGASPVMVGVLLGAHASANTALPTGETVLMTASRTGNVDVVKALLAHGADVERTEATHGQTALMWALAENHLDIARVLVQRGAGVHVRSKAGSTPLLFAAREGSLDAGRLLLDAGADVNEEASDGSSALLIATVRGHLDFARLLLEQGADPNADRAGYTALHWAAGTWDSIMAHDYTVESGEWSTLAGLKTGKREYVRTLLAYGANPNARIAKTPVRYGFQMFNDTYVIGATPFLLAAMVGDTPIMRELLANGADPSQTDNDKTTPLMVAAGLARVDGENLSPESSALQAVALVLDVGVDVNAVNNEGNTALHGAAFAGFDSVVQLLVRKGAQLNTRNKQGETPLKIAEGFVRNSMQFIRPSTASVLRNLGGVLE